MQKLVFTNANGESVDFTDFENYCVTSWEGFANVSQEVQSQTVPFHDGSVYIDTLLNDRDLTVTVAMNDRGNLQRRYELKKNLISILNPKMGIGKLVYTNDYLSRQISVVTEIPVFPTKNINDKGTLKFSVTFTANDPYWEDMNETEITVHNHETVSIDNDSDFPINVKMLIDGASENPSIYNLSNQSTVSLRGNFDNLEISSLFGKKSVTSTENKFIYNAGKFKMIVANDIQLMEVSNGVVVKDVFGNVTECFDFENGSEFVDMVYSRYFGLYIGVKYWYDSDLDNNYCDIYTSSDGLNWNHTRKSSGYSGAPNKICVDDKHGKILILNESFSMVSTDTINWQWNDISAAREMTTLTDCVYCNGLNLFIAVGYYSDKSYIRTSSGGISWTERDVFSNDWFVQSVSYSDKIGIMIAVGTNGKYAVSSDGMNWTEHSTDSSYYWNKIYYIDALNKFISIGKNGKVAVSVDGGETTPIKLIDTETSLNLTAVVSWINDLRIYVNDGVGNVLTSIDGENWSIDNEGIDGNITSIAYSQSLNLFVAVGPTKILYTSNDGRKWFKNSITLPYNLRSVAWSKKLELFVAVGENGLIYDSSDGLNWNRQTNDLTQPLWSIRWISEIEKFIVMGGYDFLMSSDGLNWTSTSLPGGLGVSSATTDTNIIYANGKLYATDFRTLTNHYLRIYVSEDDGLTWTIQNIENQNVYAIYGHIYYSAEKNLFFILGGTSEQVSARIYNYRLCLWTSLNGVVWEEKSFSTKIYNGSSIAMNYITSCTQKDNKFIATTLKGEIFSSSDIFNWSMVKDYSGFEFNTMIWAKDSIYIGGYQIIMNSKDSIKNSINSLTNNSNMDFKIEMGENKIFYANKINSDLKISFRKRYLGV